MKKSQIQSFEGLRGVAAILVVLYHVTNLHFLAIVKAGYLAVDLFFVLSGYVMCVSYGSRLSTASEFRSFMLARFARLAPLLFFSYATYFLFDNIFADGTHFISPSLFDVAATLSMTFGLGLPHIRVFNFASWSISTEFYTYVLFGMLWIHIPTRYRTACATALVVSTAIPLFTIDYAINHCSSNGKACLDNVASAGATIRCISGFFLGVSAFYFSKIDLFTELLTRPFVSTAISAIFVVIISISTTHGLAAFLCPAIFFYWLSLLVLT
jgi:peptidoglycan/LPS O-acetylase OafA/YrhL